MAKPTKKALAAAKAEVADRIKPGMLLYDVSIIADRGAALAGHKGELYRSLDDYQDLLPPDYSSMWLSPKTGFFGGDNLLVVVKNHRIPDGFQPPDPLLLGD